VKDQDNDRLAPGLAGAETMAGAAGAVLSSTYARVVAGPVLPASSVDRTRKVYVPSGRPSRSNPALPAHGAQFAIAVPSRCRRHAEVAPASVVKVHCASRSEDGPVGPPVTDVAGPVASRTYSAVAGSPRLPAASRARTLTV
jgi:hypothetical protein